MNEPFQPRQKIPHRRCGRVLVVDDDAVARLILQRWMQNWELEVELHATPRAVMTQLSHFDFDLAIIDYHIDGMNGLELIEKLRLAASYRKIELPVFAIHSTDSDKREQVRRDGVPYFLQKPLSSTELLHVLCEAGCGPRAREQEMRNISYTTEANVDLRPRGARTTSVR